MVAVVEKGKGRMSMGIRKEKRQTIFEIERRGDFSKAFTVLFEDISKTVVKTSSGKILNMIEYLEYSIRYWPYRRAAIGIKDYLLQIDVDMTKPKSDLDLLLFMELLINLLHFANKVDEKDGSDMGISWGGFLRFIKGN